MRFIQRSTLEESTSCSLHSVEVQETIKSMVNRAVYRRGPIVAQIVITLDPDRERHRDHNRIRSQQSASVRDDRIGTYPNVSARTRSSQIGDPDRDDRVRSGPNRGLNRDNPIGTYLIVSERETRS